MSEAFTLLDSHGQHLVFHATRSVHVREKRIKTCRELNVDVWLHFRFKNYEDKVKLDQSKAVCKMCKTFFINEKYINITALGSILNVNINIFNNEPS